MSKIVVLILVVTAAFAQESKKVVSQPPEKHFTLDKESPVAPTINTAKFWRLVAKAQALRRMADETPQAKAAKDAEEELQKEQASLASACGPEFILGYNQEQDVVCLPKPKETSAVPAKKEK